MSGASRMLGLAVAVVLCAMTHADMYLHNMRGSNNRLDERNRDRNNGNRLFDSQNNNRGGANVGSLYFYEGERVPLEWTNQHGCGNDYNDCQIIIQYMCDDRLRDGVTTRTIPDQPSNCLNLDCNTDVRFGMHEDYDYYMNCKYRFRNRGLFTADRRLNGNTARFTRQNENGNRRGYECPEERDHYPYWHPSPWIDIAVLTNDASRCEFYQANSENIKGRHYCSLPDDWYHHKVRTGGNRNNGFIPNTEVLCERLNLPNSEMKQFLQAQARQFYQRIAAEAKDEYEACEKQYAECALLASDPVLHNKCMEAFSNQITTAELDAAVSYCFKAGYVAHPESNCPVCLRAADCPADTSVVPRNASDLAHSGCPSAAYMVDQHNTLYCILNTCAKSLYLVDSEDLKRYDEERAAVLATRSYLVESTENPTCTSRLSLNMDCLLRGTKQATWALKDAHNVQHPWLQAPVCRENQWSRANHLGNGIGGHANGHNISIPEHVHEHCALRVRYNITTGRGDYNGRDAHDSSQVNSGLNRLNNNGPARVNVATEHNIPMTDSDRPWENARGYLFRQNPQVQIFDFDRLVQYCNDKRATILDDHTKCNTLNSNGDPTGAKTTAMRVYCPDTHSAGVKYTGNAVNMNGGCAATCLAVDGSEAPRRFCQTTANADERDFELQLAINTNQFGRTFQDRTHSYAMRDRDRDLKDRCNVIHALNVRGKRGNVVQTYPGTEYDFAPNRLHVAEDDCIHFQWTGSNTNPNNNDGQGKRGTDRHNIALMEKVRGHGGRGVERAGGYGRNGNTWTTANMEPGWEGFQLNAKPTMADRSCEWKRTPGGGALYSFVHPHDFTKCVRCSATNWTPRRFVVGADGEKTWLDCPSGSKVDFGHFGVSMEWCVRDACIPGGVPAFKNRPLHNPEWVSGLDNSDPEFAGFPSTQVAVPDALAHGHWGLSHPDHLDNVTRDGFIGLTREQLQALATLDTVQFRGEMSELDDAGTYFDMPVHKVKGVGTYYYMCTRNNNFSNRSQKGKIVVSHAPEESNIIGSTGGVITMRLEGNFVREPLGSAERIEMSDFSIDIPPMSLAGAVPVDVKVMPMSSGVGMPDAASDVLWVGPENLAASKRFPDITLMSGSDARRRRDPEPNITASFRVLSKDTVWFRLRSPLFDQVAQENPAVNVIEFDVTFSAENLPAIAPFTVELNNGNELEAKWFNVPVEYVRAVENDKMWVKVGSVRFLGANKEFTAKIITMPDQGMPMTIRMPVSVTLQYGKIYHFTNKRCIENYVKGCEFERTVVDNAVLSGGMATFARGGSQTEPAGGFYQASSGNNLPIIVGVTVACVIIALVCVGSAVYFRKHPSEWESFKDYAPKKYRAVKRSFASQV